MGHGDEVVAAGQAERLFRETGRRVLIVDAHGVPRFHEMWLGNPVIVHPTEPEAEQPWAVNRLRSAPNCRPYIVYPFTKESGWTFDKTFKCRDHIARIYLTDGERSRGLSARRAYGPYVLIEPYSKHPNFLWSFEKWAALVAEHPDLTFVQHVHADSQLIPGVRYEMANFREACALAECADLYVRSESGLCHAAAALGVRQVTLFGGCMDPDVMGGYPGQFIIADRGPQSPCGSWLPCEHCAAAMAAITVEQVSDAMQSALASVVH